MQNFSCENEFDLHENERAATPFFISMFRARTRFEKEAQGILKMHCTATYKNLLDLAWLNRFLYFWVLKCQIYVSRFLNHY